MVCGDALSCQVFAVYELEPNGHYSDIKKIPHPTPYLVDCVITNPPYSFAWDPHMDVRFESFGLAPKSKADYAFVLHGLSLLREHGEMYAILPHGVLFRGGAEGQIRQRLIEHNLLDIVIGLPGKLFANTDIPTVIIKLQRNREHKDVLFVDASKMCEAVGKNNVIMPEYIDRIIGIAQARRFVDKVAAVVSQREMAANDYNLNIPRYVDTFEPEPPVDLVGVVQDFVDTERAIIRTERELFGMMGTIVERTPQGQQVLDDANALLAAKVDERAHLEVDDDRG